MDKRILIPQVPILVKDDGQSHNKASRSQIMFSYRPYGRRLFCIASKPIALFCKLP
jgi:hypothetical protein